MPAAPLPPRDQLAASLALQRGFIDLDQFRHGLLRAGSPGGSAALEVLFEESGSITPEQRQVLEAAIVEELGQSQGNTERALGRVLQGLPPQATEFVQACTRLPAQAIGPFQVHGVVARGGQGVVLRARDPRLDREVAIKLLLSGIQATPQQRNQFALEAKALGRLRHPNLVTVYAAGEHEGSPYLVMDLIEGGSLEDRIEAEGPLPPEAAAELIAQVARGLEHAHQSDLVHRDIKPANVLISHAGQPLLTDFGLAKDLSLTSGGISKTGVFLGTPQYWPPEQAAGERQRVGPASDVYSLGGTLYAALTGAPPNQGESLVELLVNSRDEPTVPPSHLNPDVDPELEAVVLTCLEKEPEDRYATAAELADDLEAYLRGEPTSVSPPAAGNEQRVVLALLGGVALLLALLLVVIVAKREPEQETVVAKTTADPSPPSPSPRQSLSAQRPKPKPKPVSTRDRALALGKKAERFAKDGKYDDAYAAANEAIDLDPKAVQAWRARGVVRIKRRDWDGAIADLTQALDLDPSHGIVWLNRAIAYYNMRDMHRAEADATRAIREDAELAQAWSLRASVRLQNRRYADAMRDGKQAVAISPKDAAGWKAVGLSLAQTQRYKASLPYLDKALQLDPRDFVSWYNRGAARANSGNLDGAIADYRRALDLQPNNHLLWHNRGVLQRMRGNFRSALSDFEKAVKLQPNNLGYLRNRCGARAKVGDYKGALADCETFLRLQPRGKDADIIRKVRAELRRRLKKP